MSKYQFVGQDLYVGEHVRIYPHWLTGAYWMEIFNPRDGMTGMRTLVVDDFGNLVRNTTPPLKHCRLPLH